MAHHFGYECLLAYACKLTVVLGKIMYDVPPGGGGGGGGGFTMGSSSSLPRIDDVHEVNDNPSRKIKAYFSVFILKMIFVRHGCSWSAAADVTNSIYIGWESDE